jgi:hypothetical protein
MLISVTQNHIDKARVLCGGFVSSNNCPVALAIREVLGTDEVFVGGPDVIIEHQTYNLPLSVATFTLSFDCKRPVFPFKFRVGALRC